MATGVGDAGVAMAEATLERLVTEGVQAQAIASANRAIAALRDINPPGLLRPRRAQAALKTMTSLKPSESACIA